MAIFRCNCGFTKELDDSLINRRAKCKQCGETAVVVASETPDELEPSTFAFHSEDESEDEPSPDKSGEDGSKVDDRNSDAIERPVNQSRTENRTDEPEASRFRIVTASSWPMWVAVVLLCVVAWQLSDIRSEMFTVRNLPEVQKTEASPTKWEYMIESPSDIALEFALRRLGDDRWEIVSARRAVIEGGGGASYEMILKRPKNQD